MRFNLGIYAEPQLVKINNGGLRTSNWKALIMVFALHKFKHYLLGNKFVFYVNHMTLVLLNTLIRYQLYI
jgi:hypothetical protein